MRQPMADREQRKEARQLTETVERHVQRGDFRQAIAALSEAEDSGAPELAADWRRRRLELANLEKGTWQAGLAVLGIYVVAWIVALW